MSQDPSDESTEASNLETPRDYGFDDWPVEGTGEDDVAAAEGRMTSANVVGASATSVVLYDEEAQRVFEAEPDETNRRLVPKEGTERELDPSETLGDALEDLGERLEWDSLTEFARDRLQDDPDRDASTEATGSDDRAGDESGTPSGVSSFTRSNVAASKPHDMEFTGSYTYRSPEDRAYTVERSFLVTFDDPDDPGEATVEVVEHVLRAEDSDPERRAGDADPVREGSDRFEIELSESDSERAIENRIEQRCKEWHDARPEPIA